MLPSVKITRLSEKTPEPHSPLPSKDAALKTPGSGSEGVRTANAHRAGRAEGAEHGDAKIPAQLLVRLGLPVDRLSASVVSFARFFLLPLNKGLPAKLRRMVLAAQAEQAVRAGPEPRQNAGGAEPAGAGGRVFPQAKAGQGAERAALFREALALAAAAAEHKGLELSPGALAGYAAAIDPDARGRDPDKGRGRDKEPGDKDETPKKAPGPAALREKCREAETPLLKLLNHVPGRDGRRWIALPFDFSAGGIHYQVSLRILLASSPGGAERMALDIVSGPALANNGAALAKNAATERRLFIMDKTGPGPARLEVRLSSLPEKRALKTLGQELSTALEIPRDNIVIIEGEAEIE
jgi:hypothetical protein